MLSYALAIAVGLSSLVLFLTAFLMPKIHRQDDFLWSGVGLFYAIVLWFCATNIHGAVLLGQLAAVALLCSYTWQVVTLRKVIAEPEEPNLAASFSFTGFFGKLLNRSSESDSSETSISEETSASEEESSDTDTKGEEVSETEDSSTETEDVTSETATEDSSTETVETISETEDSLDDSESLDTGDITSEIEDSPDNSVTESTVLEAGDSEDSMETIETKIDEIFQEKDITETDSNFEIEDSTADTDTDDLTSKEVESSNWENELSNWDKEESSSQENQESVDNKKITLEELVSLESNKGEESTETTNDESQPSASDRQTPIDQD